MMVAAGHDRCRHHRKEAFLDGDGPHVALDLSATGVVSPWRQKALGHTEAYEICHGFFLLAIQSTYHYYGVSWRYFNESGNTLGLPKPGTVRLRGSDILRLQREKSIRLQIQAFRGSIQKEGEQDDT
jgi:hypothetical protein